MTESALDWPDDRSPLEELKDPVFERAGIVVLIKRDDLLRPFGGNKGRKLKYAWKEFKISGKSGLLTMGGPFSNHIHAFARLCSHFKVPGKVLVRGEIDDMSNPVLNDVRSCGIDVIAMSRADYATRYSDDFIKQISTQYPRDYFVHEGGAGISGISGCIEVADEILQDSVDKPDIILVAAGTGTTAAGISSRVGQRARVIAISALRKNIIAPAYERSLKLLGPNAHHPELNTDYHFGGFARWSDRLIRFIRDFEEKHGITLDPLYTGKTMFALFDMAASRVFPAGSNIVVVHTGGMPGRVAFNYRFPGLLESLS